MQQLNDEGQCWKGVKGTGVSGAKQQGQRESSLRRKGKSDHVWGGDLCPFWLGSSGIVGKTGRLDKMWFSGTTSLGWFYSPAAAEANTVLCIVCIFIYCLHGAHCRTMESVLGDKQRRKIKQQCSHKLKVLSSLPAFYSLQKRQVS